MKIAFNRAPRRSPWGGGAHFATTFADYLTARGHEVVHRLEDDIDVIVMLDPRQEEGGFDVYDIDSYKWNFPVTQVIHRVNDTGKTRGGDVLDNIIINANRMVADATVFISKWVADYFVTKGLTSSNSTVITNGCEKKFFYPKQQHELSNTLKLVTHHWSDNVSKGLDLYRHIDKLIDVGAPIEFTYVGRYPKDFVTMARHTKIIAPLYGEALGDELRKHDVYVTAARWEACGSHHVEGAASGLPIVYHNDGGGVVELCKRYGEGIGDVSEFKAALTKIRNHYRSYAASAESADLSSETMCAKYLDVLTRM